MNPYLVFPIAGIAAAVIAALVLARRDDDDGATFGWFSGTFCVAVLGLLFFVDRDQAASGPAGAKPERAAEHPVVKALEGYTPANTTRAAIDAVVAKGGNLNDTLVLMRPILAGYAKQELGFADAAARIAWARSELGALEELRTIDVSACAQLARSQESSDNFIALAEMRLSEANQQAFQTAFAQVMTSYRAGLSGERPSDGISLEAMQRRYQALRSDFESRHGRDVVDTLTRGRFQPATPVSDNNRLCAFRIDQLSTILREPPAMAGRLIDAVMR
jgi:hypothetical protein